MDSQVGRRVVRGIAVFIFAAVGVAAGAANAQIASTDRGPQPLEVTLRDDAALSDVFFVSATEGWAVGDRGVVWHTRNAGANWEQQDSHVNCALNGVFFLDAKRGWAVGGASKPYARATSGIVLATVDGGTTWTPARGAELLPALNGVRFLNAQQAIAYGASSPMYTSGACLTRDGGRSWQPVPCDGTGGWLTGDFVEGGVGALAGANGRFATLVSGEVKQSPIDSGSLRSLRAMRLVAPTGGWIVGDGGVVATTNDLGRSWQTSPGDLPDGATEHFDFHGVAVQGGHVWIAGSPGSRVFHSSDGGQSWQAYATGQTAPLRGLTFLDAQRGWAVGELGAILATRDGGQTWRVQRSGGTRAALLGVFARPGDVPLELITQQGAAEGYLAVVNVLFRAPATPASAGGASLEIVDSERSREAMLLAGATSGETAWRFPLPPDDLALDPRAVLDALDRSNDGRAADRLLSAMVRQVRMWRPDVIVTQGRGSGDSDSLPAFVEQLVMQAVEAAADPKQFEELSTDAGLEAWQVKRVYGVLTGGVRGREVIATGQFSPQLGGSLADWSAPARRLLSTGHTPPPDTFGVNLLMNRVDGGTQGVTGPSANDLFRGLGLAPGGDARRRVAALPAGDVDQLRRLAARRRNLEELLERKAGDAAWAAQVVQLIDGLPATGGGELVFQLADGYRTSGRLDLAADTYYLLARRYPEHPLSEQSLRWLVQYYASSEASTRTSGRLSPTGSASANQGKNVRLANGSGTGESTGEASGTLVQAGATAPIRGETPPAVGLAREERLRRAVELGKYLESARPAMFAEPAVRFPLVAAERQLGFPNPAKRYFLTLRPLPASDPWRRCAETEAWLAEPRDLPPQKALGRCRPAGERPHLDGQLDEPFWNAAEVLRLQGDRLVATGGSPVDMSAGEPPAATEVRLAYDKEFLYIAVRCPKAAGGDYALDDRPRPHDGDLSTHDRVALRLDVDRDYTTAFELTVDHRGWTRDARLGDASWNPTWYVAASSAGESWTVEAAVPLAELVDKPAEARHVWALGVRRTIPRVGYESWTGNAASAESPDQFGLLLFD